MSRCRVRGQFPTGLVSSWVLARVSPQPAGAIRCRVIRSSCLAQSAPRAEIPSTSGTSCAPVFALGFLHRLSPAFLLTAASRGFDTPPCHRGGV